MLTRLKRVRQIIYKMSLYVFVLSMVSFLFLWFFFAKASDLAVLVFVVTGIAGVLAAILHDRMRVADYAEKMVVLIRQNEHLIEENLRYRQELRRERRRKMVDGG